MGVRCACCECVCGVVRVCVVCATRLSAVGVQGECRGCGGHCVRVCCVCTECESHVCHVFVSRVCHMCVSHVLCALSMLLVCVQWACKAPAGH